MVWKIEYSALYTIVHLCLKSLDDFVVECCRNIVAD